MWESIWQHGFDAWAEILLAAGLDLLLPKPKALAQWQRPLYAWIDTVYRQGRRRKNQAARPLFHSAVLVLVAAVLVAALAGVTPVLLSRFVAPFWGSLSRIALLFLALAGGQTLWGNVRVARALRQDKPEQARLLLSTLLARDTQKMSRQGLARAGCESLGRSLLSAVVGPLFWMGVGLTWRRWNIGIPLVYFYISLQALYLYTQKNPQSSLELFVGHWIYKWMVYLPARLAAATLLLSALIFQRNARSGFWFLVQDRSKDNHPGDAWPLSTLAGALGIRLGGGAYYQGVWQERPSVGFDVHSPDLPQLTYALGMTALAALCGILLTAFLPSLLIPVCLGVSVMIYWGYFRGLRSRKP